MKKFYRFSLLALSAICISSLTSCSDDNEPDNTITVKIGFQNVPVNLIGGPTAQGTNLYYSETDPVGKGYLVFLENNKYAQFSLNYGFGYSANFQNAGWGYSLTNGGLAISKWHDMETATYENQLSVYDTTSPSGGNFVVANGSSMVIDPRKAKYSDYNGCGKVYITNEEGYEVANPGKEETVRGDDEEAWFKSVYVNNTTYTYLTLRDGDKFGNLPIKDQNGWFKVQFIAFEDDDPDERPLDYTEVYLANYDESLNLGWTGIIDEWVKVDLSKLPECSILVINFVGSNWGEWGLNTPAYCALDQFEIAVAKE